MLGYFGAAILSSDILTPGRMIAFTFESGEWFFAGSTTDIKNGLADRMSNYGEIVRVSRGLFSDRYVVTVVPTVGVSLSEWLSAFDSSWRDMGYGSISFVTAEGGEGSTQAGGFREITEQAGEDILSPITGSISKSLLPLLPWMIGIFGIYFLVTMKPMSLRKGV